MWLLRRAVTSAEEVMRVRLVIAMTAAIVVSVAITAYFALSILPAFVVGMACGAVAIATVVANR